MYFFIFNFAFQNPIFLNNACVYTLQRLGAFEVLTSWFQIVHWGNRQGKMEPGKCMNANMQGCS